MRFTKLVHSCVRLEKDGAVVVIDPGVWSDATMALSGATAVFDVINELDRLVGTLLAKVGGADLAGDTARFMATFRTTYLGGAE